MSTIRDDNHPGSDVRKMELTFITDLLRWLAVLVGRQPAAPRQCNQVAYETAYRGALCTLAGWRIKSKEQEREGKAGLAYARRLHKHSSGVGWNDVIEDLKEAVVASAITIGPTVRWDADFLEQQIRARPELRMGVRPASQFRLTWSDAIQSAEFYQEVMRSQVGRQKMVGNVAQIVGAIALLAVAAFLFSSGTGTWSTLEQMSPAPLTSERVFQLKILYSIITAAFFGRWDRAAGHRTLRAILNRPNDGPALPCYGKLMLIKVATGNAV